MAQISDKYIKGFVKTCFEAGVHEKQAAALLDAVIASNEAMEKSAGGPSAAKGLFNLLSGLGHLGGAAVTKGVPAAWKLATLPFKPFAWYGKNIIMNPAITMAKNPDKARRVFGHVALTGALPAALAVEGPVKWFQQWRDSSDSPLAAGINDLIGNPEWFKDGLFGNPLSSGSSSLPEGPVGIHRAVSGSSDSESPSPRNIPGVKGYSSGEAKLKGYESGRESAKLSDSEKSALDEYLDAKDNYEKSIDTGSGSVSAARRAREGSRGNAELEKVMKDKYDALNRVITEGNSNRSSRNARNRAAAAEAANRMRQAVASDKFQSRVGFDDESTLGHLGNKALQAVGIMDDNADLAAREQKLNALRDINNSWDKWTPEEMVDANKLLNDAINSRRRR